MSSRSAAKLAADPARAAFNSAVRFSAAAEEERVVPIENELFSRDRARHDLQDHLGGISPLPLGEGQGVRVIFSLALR